MRTRLLAGALLLALTTHTALAQSQRTIKEGQVEGVLVLPAQVPAPAIFVLHTAYGRVHAADVAMAKALAAAGFVAFAPEYPLQDRDRSSTRRYIDWMKARPEARGMPMGVVGFSAGGTRAFFFAAADPAIKAVVSYYGTYDFKNSSIAAQRSLGDPGPVGHVADVHAASLILHGDQDSESTGPQVRAMEAALKAAGLPVEVVTYPGAHHNFDRGSESGPDRTTNGTMVIYNGAAAKDAEARTIAWFAKYLK